ncbi:MAG: AraC family transcriptional regulator [Gammaproteobacteria bacterium]|nr:AraC family transcriptional regulator [Gammaproteobacteria bacterium]
MAQISDRAEELTALMNSLVAEDGIFDTSWPGLQVARFSAPQARSPMPYKASICFAVQGQKRVFLGDEIYTYDPFNYLVVPMAMPLDLEITQASEQKPLLGLALEFDLTMLSELLLNINTPTKMVSQKQPALFVSPISFNVQDALIRLLRLLNKPADLQVLGAAIVREIYYWVLQGEQGDQLRHLLLRDSGSYRIVNLISYLNEHYTEQISIDEIAQIANMSTSALHQKFRDVTCMSPLQYLKKIRLHNARILMVERGIKASDAGFKVGYTNPSQFSREFKRLFGLPPVQMVKTLV